MSDIWIARGSPWSRLRKWLVVVIAAVLLSGCQYAWPDVPDMTQGGLVAVAAKQIGQVNPPYSATGFWCAKFVNAVAVADQYPGWAAFDPDTVGPTEIAQNLPITTTVPTAGDLVYFDLSPAIDHGYIDHMGIVMFVKADGSFGSIEGNSDEYPNAVEVVLHPPVGQPDAGGVVALGFAAP